MLKVASVADMADIDNYTWLTSHESFREAIETFAFE